MSQRARVRVKVAESFRQYYVSGSVVGHSLTEFRLLFFRDSTEVAEGSIEVLSQPSVVREMLLEVVMSPVQAKLLAEQLSRNIEQYERVFGKIPAPGGGRKPPETMYT